jgi:hypothetical protein
MIEWWMKYRLLIFLLMTLCSAAGIYGYRQYNRRVPDTHRLKPAFLVSAREFIKNFQSNEAKAGARYADKAISVNGVIYVVQDVDTAATVILNDGSSISSVICQFERENVREVQGLKEGDKVTIKGICTGYLMDVVMVRCVVDH